MVTMGYTREYFIGFICFWLSMLIAFVLFHYLLSAPKFIHNSL